MTAPGITHTAVCQRRRCFALVQVLLFSLAWTAPSTAWAPPLSTRPTSRHPGSRAITRLCASASLSSLSVKELRQLVKESTAERGVLSRLKRKQDLVDYLQENSNDRVVPVPVPAPENAPLVVSDAAQQEKTTTDVRVEVPASNGRKKAPLNMPPLPLEPVNGADVKTSPSPAPTSPKDVIFGKVYDLYPDLRDAPVTNSSLAIEDARQVHHPIFRNNNVNSDMDVVFLGTASCTPGVTRGVSCTALRLNWRRRAAFLNPETGKMGQASSFQGGTWLFDVGECTQVCLLSLCCVLSCGDLLTNANEEIDMLAPVRDFI